MAEKNCNSCHHLPQVLWNHREAKMRGFTIDEQKFDEWLKWSDGNAIFLLALEAGGNDKKICEDAMAKAASFIAKDGKATSVETIAYRALFMRSSRAPIPPPAGPSPLPRAG